MPSLVEESANEESTPSIEIFETKEAALERFEDTDTDHSSNSIVIVDSGENVTIDELIEECRKGGYDRLLVVTKGDAAIVPGKQIDRDELYTQSSQTEKIDFEIALLTIISAGVLTIHRPDDIAYQILQGGVLLSTGLALARRLVVVNERASEEAFLAYSRPVIEYVVFLSIVYLFGQAVRFVESMMAIQVDFSILFLVAVLGIGVPLRSLFFRLVEGANVHGAAHAYNMSIEVRQVPLIRFFAWEAQRTMRKIPSTTVPQELEVIESLDPPHWSQATWSQWAISILALSGPILIRIGFVSLGYLLFHELLLSITIMVIFSIYHDSTIFLFQRYGVHHHYNRRKHYLIVFGAWLPAYLFCHLLLQPSLL